MSNAFYKLYEERVFELAKTMVIRFDPAARAVNQNLLELGYSVDVQNPQSWRYYLNLAGEHHPYDTPMDVISLDNPSGGLIEFNKTTLAANRFTREGYSVDTRFYKRLVQRFPKQEQLIFGIINPVNIDDAVNAEDGDILYYDERLVAVNEDDLIPRTQEWIKRFLGRWYIHDYSLVDDLYMSTILGIMYTALPIVIMNIRLSNARTSRAHTFHIREYLESNGRLAEFIPHLNLKQRLFLYRNINWINRNVGKIEVFDKLVENILTERNLPLYGYSARHDLLDVPENHDPGLVFDRHALNFHELDTGLSKRSLSYIIERQRNLFDMNTEDAQYESERVEKSVIGSNNNDLPTKVLESTYIDTSDVSVYPISLILMNHWISYALTGAYTAQISITIPTTGETVVLSVKDSLILYIYCVRHGYIVTDDPLIVSDDIPEMGAAMIMRNTPPTIEELRAVTPVEVTAEQLEELLDIDYSLGPMDNPDSFRDACELIQSDMMKQRRVFSRTENYKVRGFLQGAMSMFYKRDQYQLVSEPTTFTTWLVNKGINLGPITSVDYRALATQIVRNATGVSDYNSNLQRDMHESMVKLIQRLSSYSVQFLPSVTQQVDAVVDNPGIRMGEFTENFKASSDLPLKDVTILDASQSFSDSLGFDIAGDMWITIDDGPTASPDGEPHPSFTIYDKMHMEFHSNFGLSVTGYVPLSGIGLIEGDIRQASDFSEVIDASTVPEYKPPTP